MSRAALVAVPPVSINFPPLNIALLTAELKKQGHAARAFDFNIDAFAAADSDGKSLWTLPRLFEWDDSAKFGNVVYPKYLAPYVPFWVRQILDFKPEIVGFSITKNRLWEVLAQAIKSERPEIKIVIGGPICSRVAWGHYEPGQWVDAVVSGEGERTLLDLVDDFAKNGKFDPVPGATILVDGSPAYGGPRPVIADLDSTEYPDFSDLDLARYRELGEDGPRQELQIYTSRGCVARCHFCADYKMWSAKYRQKSPKRVADEMECFSRRFGIKYFVFADLVFNGHPDWLVALAKELEPRHLDIGFWAHARLDRRLTPELLKSLRNVGLSDVSPLSRPMWTGV